MLSFTFVTLIQSINADELEETSNDQMAHTLNETSGLLLRLLNRSCRSSRSISILIYKVKSSPRTIDFFHTVTMEYLANLAFFCSRLWPLTQGNPSGFNSWQLIKLGRLFSMVRYSPPKDSWTFSSRSYHLCSYATGRPVLRGGRPFEIFFLSSAGCFDRGGSPEQIQ